MWREETIRDGDENHAVVEDIRGAHEVKERPEMQLEAAMVEMELFRNYLMKHHEHMVMDAELENLIIERFLGRVFYMLCEPYYL